MAFFQVGMFTQAWRLIAINKVFANNNDYEVFHSQIIYNQLIIDNLFTTLSHNIFIPYFNLFECLVALSPPLYHYCIEILFN